LRKRDAEMPALIHIRLALGVRSFNWTPWEVL
jgi:hypothetical protein